MRNALLVCAALGLLAACDQEAVQQTQSRQRFVQALDKVGEAERGYIPAAEGDVPLRQRHLQDYRQEKLAEAAESLQAVLRTGAPEQKNGARRMLAEIHASAARATARRALVDSAELSNQGAAMLGQLIAIERADARIPGLAGDDASLLVQLRTDAEALQRRVTTDLEPKIKDYEQRLAALDQKIEQLKSQAATSLEQARAQRSAAFTKTGQESFNLYEQAAAAERRADTANAESQRIAVQRDLFASESAIVRRQAELTRATVQSTQAEVAQSTQRQGEFEQARGKVTEEKQRLVGELEKALSALAANYNRQVEQKLVAADAEMIKALDLLEQATNDARDARDKRGLKFDLLVKQAGRLDLLLSHIMASGDYGVQLDLVARAAARRRQDDPLLPQALAGLFDKTAGDVTTRQRQLVDEAHKLVGEALGLAAEISANQEDELAQAANDIAAQINRYKTRIDEAQLAP